MSTAPDPRDLELFVRRCSDCHKEIMWAKTEAAGEWMPVDAAPDVHGNVLVKLDPADPRRALAAVIGSATTRAAMRAGGWDFRTHHRVSCAYADRWARKPKALRPTPTGFRQAVSTADEAAVPEGLF
jgi:hypothetical protein